MRALVIEDDAALREQIIEVMKGAGFAVDSAANGIDGNFMAEEYSADIAIIDLGLPEVPGLEIIRRAREAGRSYPILILTARDGWQSKVEGLEAGADDYLVKPFHKEELIARVRALLRRSGAGRKPNSRPGPWYSTPRRKP